MGSEMCIRDSVYANGENLASIGPTRSVIAALTAVKRQHDVYTNGENLASIGPTRSVIAAPTAVKTAA